MTHLYDSYVYENSLELDEQKRTIQLNVNSNPVIWLVRHYDWSVLTTAPPIDWIYIESYHNEINMFEQWRPIVLGQAQFR